MLKSMIKGLALVGGLMVAASASANPSDMSTKERTMAKGDSHLAMMKPTKEQALEMLEGWKETPRKTGMEIINKYGPPDEITQTRMVWLDAGPWKWSILTNDPTQHLFPVPHEDVLEQAISYEIPEDRVDELAKYDGSVVANRTRGELSARCDKEGANFLAVNLANDVATGTKTVVSARAYYAKAIDAFMKKNKTDPYMTGLKFEIQAASPASDPDVSSPQ